MIALSLTRRQASAVRRYDPRQVWAKVDPSADVRDQLVQLGLFRLTANGTAATMTTDGQLVRTQLERMPKALPDHVDVQVTATLGEKARALRDDIMTGALAHTNRTDRVRAAKEAVAATRAYNAHTNCDHDNTKVARAACRRQKARES